MRVHAGDCGANGRLPLLLNITTLFRQFREEAERRLEEELRLVEHHNLSGFFLVYRDIMNLAREVALRVRGEAPRAFSGLPPGRGRGIAFGVKSGPTTGLSYSTVRLLADGSAIVFCGTSDMGQGARTVFAQIVAREMGIPIESVNVIMGDTATVPYDQQTSASRSTRAAPLRSSRTPCQTPSLTVRTSSITSRPGVISP